MPTTNEFRIAALVALLSTAYASSPRAAEIQPIRWVIADGQEVDKAQVTRIYDAACAWIEENLNTSRAPVQPKLTIHIGEACPDDGLAEACFSPATAELYLKRWEESSASAVANATLIAGLIQIMDREQLRRTVAGTSEQPEDSLTAVNDKPVSDGEPNLPN
jgi:hypothetical protein